MGDFKNANNNKNLENIKIYPSDKQLDICVIFVISKMFETGEECSFSLNTIKSKWMQITQSTKCTRNESIKTKLSSDLKGWWLLKITTGPLKQNWKRKKYCDENEKSSVSLDLKVHLIRDAKRCWCYIMNRSNWSWYWSKLGNWRRSKHWTLISKDVIRLLRVESHKFGGDACRKYGRCKASL